MEAFKEPLTKEEEEFWILKHRAGEPQAKDILIERNLRFVRIMLQADVQHLKLPVV